MGAALTDAGIRYETAWSPVMRPPGGLTLDDIDAQAYTHMVFTCGPATGTAIAELHARFAHCTRIAIGVSVINPADPVVAGFHRVIARDHPHSEPRPDLAAVAPLASADDLPPVIGVFLTAGQQEYGPRRRHDALIDTVRHWLTGFDAARLDLDTRLDPRDWRLPATPEQLQSVIRRLDAVVTMRMHGLVLALRSGVPALALDPVDGGGKVTAQARALGWPAVLAADAVSEASLHAHFEWCLADGRAAASRASSQLDPGALVQGALEELLDCLVAR
ncbi:polysaccharide pyruvyl transferase family protein [Pseudoclavibacter endophyticus]|uniref:polysaccharide pyruvyl transferase family protein n=1 Tax=Pseudoclavibacter endophyticus TaxID=1778590 RepID=UPI001CE4192C|nr:polysaccharide pyruvyl transferase family protein [Pseudoclavibacter endophyticus]